MIKNIQGYRSKSRIQYDNPGCPCTCFDTEEYISDSDIKKSLQKYGYVTAEGLSSLVFLSFEGVNKEAMYERG